MMTWILNPAEWLTRLLSGMPWRMLTVSCLTRHVASEHEQESERQAAAEVVTAHEPHFP
jgi:hypothetical protein